MRRGADFFEGCKRDVKFFVHQEDQAAFVEAMDRRFLTEALSRSPIWEMVYRRIKGGDPFYVRMRVTRMDKDPDLIVIAVADIDELMRQRQAEERIREERLVYARLHALTGNFICVYVVDPETGRYREFSATDDYVSSFAQAKDGEDFFGTVRSVARDFNHPEDVDRFLASFTRENILAEIERSGIFILSYRLMMDGQSLHVQMNAAIVEEEEGPRLIVGLNNVDAQYRQQERERKKNVTYTQIAERLASHFDFIYYIDCETARYAEISTKKKSGELNIQEEGSDFFSAAWKNAERLIFPEDLERIRLFLNRDHLISRLETSRQVMADYRMVLGDGQVQYTRMSATYSSDHSHLIICVENRDQDVRMEQERLAALSVANEMARRDELTHTKNKTAYHEMEKELRLQLGEGRDPFGMVVCDINGLKAINDREGHQAGDDYIRASCQLICRVFSHSPVFRIGGDEFVVVLRGQDYENRQDLLSDLRRQVEEHNRLGKGPIVASGMAAFDLNTDHSVEDVFNRADSRMYGEKARLKELKLLQESHSMKDKANIRIITEERRAMLDMLFKSYDVVAQGAYVFLCDMKYDFSRWSVDAVKKYGLPAEYMYGAGDIWEKRIHEEDRAAYHEGIDEIFTGVSSGHNMRYRARRATGEYDVCTCRGVVIRDPAGEPDYFVGAIRVEVPGSLS